MKFTQEEIYKIKIQPKSFDLKGADLSGTNLGGAFLRNTNLSGANLSGAQYNKKTKWTKGFDPIKAGAVLMP